MERTTQGTRDRKILEIVKGLLLSEVAFQEIFKKYKEGYLRFLDIGSWVDDKGHSLLYSVKEQCHAIFRYIETGPLHKKEWLLDLAIGSIFHEAMKLRENLYQIEIYRPKYLQYKLRAGKSAYEKSYLQQFERIISKADQGLGEGMEETQSLFQDATAQLIDFFKESAGNKYLVRFLLENRPLLRKVYGSKKAKEIFNVMFEKGLLDAYSFAGRSYLESEHYDLSSKYFSNALKIDPHDQILRFLLNFSLGMNAYYKNADSKALSYLSRLVSFRLDGKLEKGYLSKTEEVCRKISSELEDEKRLKASHKSRLLADQIRKML